MFVLFFVSAMNHEMIFGEEEIGWKKKKLIRKEKKKSGGRRKRKQL